MPYTSVLGSVSASDLALVIMSLPRLLYTSGSQDDSAAVARRTDGMLTTSVIDLESTGREDSVTDSTVALQDRFHCLQDPALLQPISMLVSATSSSFTTLPPHLLHGVACALAEIGFPASTAWLEAHARAMANAEPSVLSELQVEALDRVYAVMRSSRRGTGK